MWKTILTWVTGTVTANWGKLILWGAVAAGILYAVHIVRLAGEQDQIIAELKTAQLQDAATIETLRTQYAKDIKLVTEEKDHALQLSYDAQARLNAIQNTPSSDDGPVRPVLRDTLKWMRGKTSNDYSNRKNVSAK